jgi:squalene synthase HpnC
MGCASVTRMGVGHYENFPVASLLVPAPLRPAIKAIYRFARAADDIADEGDAVATERLAGLTALRASLDSIEQGCPGAWTDLATAVRSHGLSMRHFQNLISAFEQDVTTTRYANFDAVRDYCRRSADPVGRLLLELYDRRGEQADAWSDSICTGLQLTNFWQDIALDWDKGRVYLPQDDLARFEVDEQQIASRRVDARWSALLRFEVERARRLLHSGAPLTRVLPGRAGFELRLVLQGGLRILERIDACDGDVFNRRPQLDARDWLLMGLRSLRDLTAWHRQ